MAERTTVRLPEELLRRAKRKAAKEGRTLTSLIEDGLRLVVSNGDKSARQTARRTLPVSSAVGWIRPGIDLSDSASIEERYDLEYADRLRRGFE